MEEEGDDVEANVMDQSIVELMNQMDSELLGASNSILNHVSLLFFSIHPVYVLFSLLTD